VASRGLFNAGRQSRALFAVVEHHAGGSRKCNLINHKQTLVEKNYKNNLIKTNNKGPNDVSASFGPIVVAAAIHEPHHTYKESIEPIYISFSIKKKTNKKKESPRAQTTCLRRLGPLS
jgi:hypothetical protein